MTGEMHKSDVTQEDYPLHFAIASEFGGKVQPFDLYQGPYVVLGADIRAGNGPYAYCPRGLGVVRLWVCSDDGALGTIYNEATERESEPFLLCGSLAELEAVEAARSVLAKESIL